MSRLNVVAVDDCSRWDSIVRDFRNHDVYYLNGYAKTYQLLGIGEPCLLYYNDGVTRAVNVVIKRDIAELVHFKGKIENDTLYDISSPYGYGGFWIEGSDHEAVERSYVEYCRDEGYVSEFVRFHLLSDYWKVFRGIVQGYCTNVVRSLETDFDGIIADTEYKVRKNVRRARDMGLVTEFDMSGSKLEAFMDLYYSTMRRNHAEASYYFPRDFFRGICALENNHVFVHALHDDKVVSTELVLYNTDSCYSFLGGTDSSYYAMRPNDLLKYEIIRWAKEQGITRYILGGGYRGDDGIFRYKKSFAPRGLQQYYVGKRVFHAEAYAHLMRLRNLPENRPEEGFFPAYRA